MTNLWNGATVVITGGTGSLGQAFARYALGTLPVHAVRVFSRDERKQAEMGAALQDDRLRLLLGDVRDADRLRRAFTGADIVIHAAALKRVDAFAHDPGESIKTNIDGSANVVDAALDMGVSRVLGISTDKGCQPANIYGATKAVMERLFTFSNEYAGAGPTRFACVRYGNVLGSRGSVLELWERQYAATGRVQITDPTMTRFWLTLDQACEYVRYAVEDTQSGEVFVPGLVRSRVLDLAEAYFGAPVPYDVVGLRPGGEKLHEDIVSVHEPWQHWDHGGCVLHARGPIRGYERRSCDSPLTAPDRLRRILAAAGLLPAARAVE